MSTQIKISGKFPGVTGLYNEFIALTKQLIHKNDAATKTELSAVSSSLSAVSGKFTGKLSGTITFYASSTSGGATDQLNTVVIEEGLIKSWSQA